MKSFDRVFGLAFFLALSCPRSSWAQVPTGVTLEIQDTVLLNPPFESGHGLNVIWEDPYLFTASRQSRSVSLYRRENQGWNLLDTQEGVLAGVGSNFGLRAAGEDGWYYVSAPRFGDPVTERERGIVVVFRRVGDELIRTGSFLPPPDSVRPR